VQIYVDPNLRYGFSSKEGIFSPPSDVSAVEKYYRGLGYEPVFQTASAPPYLTGTYTGKEIPPPTAYPTTPTTPTYSGVEELIQEIQKYQPPIPSNIPEGVSSYVYKDPLGGSSLVFDYTIKPGDSLEKIASNFGVSIDEIKKLNPDKKSIKGALLEGENIRIPAKYQEPEFNEILQQMLKAGATPEQINQLQSQLYDLWVSKKLPGGIADNVVYGLFQNEINQLNDLLNVYIQRTSAESYRDTYQKLLDEYGISADYQRLFDIQRIMRGTLDDVLREAAEAGGIVTQSQVAAVVKFRQGILKQEADILSDIIDMKEKMIDKIMKYTEMDRDELNKRLDKALRIQEKIADLQLKAAKWRYDYQKDLMEKNQKKIESYVKAGLLHSFSPKYLATFTNPYHTNYAGYTATELGVMAEISRRIAVDAESKRKKAAIDLQNAILRGQLLQKELAKPEKPTVWNMLGGRYIYPQETTRGVAQNIVDVFYQYDF
jgi:LysM repeat protein